MNRRQIPLIIYAVVVLLIAWIALDFHKTYTSSVIMEPPRLTPDMATPVPQQPRHPLAYYAVIGGQDLFCRECSERGATPSAAPSASSQPQEGALAGKLRLLGTAIALNGENYAVLEHLPSREQRLYKTGDAADEFEIIRIEPSQVTVRYGAKEETLVYIPEEPPRRSVAQQLPKVPPSKPGYFGRAITRDEVVKCSETIDALLSSVGAEAFAKNGEPYGVRLARVDVRSCLGRMGLRSGDIVLSVNERTVTSITDAADAFASLGNAQSCRFRVDRNGWPRSFNLMIQ